MFEILNGKKADKIYQVDYNQNRHGDIYLPWLFFITFSNFNQFLEIEGDFDGSHIKINIYDHSELEAKLNENNLAHEPGLWQVYNTTPDETLGLLTGRTIDYIEYGIDKDSFEINGAQLKGQKDIFTFIRFNCGNLSLTVFEGSATGLGVTTNKDIHLPFEETFDCYSTK